MDYTTSKAFVIGVGIFVTLTIVGSFILILGEVADIYNETENTNTSIIAQYDNVYSMYAGAELNALNLMNTLRKYETDSDVRIGIKFKKEEVVDYGENNAELLRAVDNMIALGTLSYEKMFDVSVVEDGIYIRIIFTER